MATRKSNKNKGILKGFTSKLEGELFTMDIGALAGDDTANAIQAYKEALTNPEMKKSIFIIRKEAKPLSSAARAFMEEIDKCEDSHILASALVFSSISLMYLAKMMTKEDETDTRFFTDRQKAEQWLREWKK